MENKVLISITEREEGLEIRVGEECYGNIALIGLLEKIKFNLLSELPEENLPPVNKKSRETIKTNYDA